MKPIVVFMTGLLVACPSFAERVRVQPRRSSPPPADSTPRAVEPPAAPAVTENNPSSVPRGRVRIQRRTSSPSSAPSQSSPSNGGTYSPVTSPGFSPSGVSPERTRVVPRSGVVATPPSRTNIIHNPSVARHIRRQRRHETRAHRYYWHNVGGSRYCHYYDGGVHWYGFYSGPRFHWTRYHGGHWWWFDAGFDRWTYWSDGNWWWPSPSGVVYVVVNDAYVPAQDMGISSPPQTPEALPEPAEENGGAWSSPDGRRRVEVFGPRSEALLYDITTDSPVFMTHLGYQVDKVRFSGGTTGEPLQILLDYKDGKFSLLNADGRVSSAN